MRSPIGRTEIGMRRGGGRRGWGGSFLSPPRIIVCYVRATGWNLGNHLPNKWSVRLEEKKREKEKEQKRKKVTAVVDRQRRRQSFQAFQVPSLVGNSHSLESSIFPPPYSLLLLLRVTSIYLDPELRDSSVWSGLVRVWFDSGFVFFSTTDATLQIRGT